MTLRLRIITTAAIGLALAGCASIDDRHGYVADEALVQAVTPGIDNQTSVEMTLGRPTFASQFGEPVWYYVTSTTSRTPFGRPRITDHRALAVYFDGEGNVTSVERTGMDLVAQINPEGDETPTLGRDSGFFEDLFGNIGQIGSGAGGGGGPGGQ